MLSTVLPILKYRQTHLAQPFEIFQEFQQPGLFCSLAWLFTEIFEILLNIGQLGCECAAERLDPSLFGKLAAGLHRMRTMWKSVRSEFSLRTWVIPLGDRRRLFQEHFGFDRSPRRKENGLVMSR
jgi:hypothetical protein